MTIAIMQPGYLPWMGFFELMYHSEIFVFRDEVQYDKSWRNRNQIKTPRGVRWLTVPLHVHGRPKISEVKIDNSRNWRIDHLRILEANYSKAPYFRKYFSHIQEVLNQEWGLLIDLDIALIKVIARALGLHRKMILASDLKVDNGKVDKLIAICKELGANVFYEPAGGKDYLGGQVERFRQEGIELIFQDFHCPNYNQLFGEFLPNLSTLDLLFNEGEKSLNYILCQNSKF